MIESKRYRNLNSFRSTFSFDSNILVEESGMERAMVGINKRGMKGERKLKKPQAMDGYI